jgi:outer membrane protein TolC
VQASETSKSLKELIEIALLNNTTIAVAKSRVDAKDAGIAFAKAGYLPQIALQGQAASYDMNTSSVNERDSAMGASATFSQLLYDFGGTTDKIAASKSAYSASLKQLDATIESVVIGVKKAYYTILLLHQ